jgi:hypothetical protein
MEDRKEKQPNPPRVERGVAHIRIQGTGEPLGEIVPPPVVTQEELDRRKR